MSEILCSTGALLPYGGDYRLLEPLSEQLLYDGYEFMIDAPYYEEAEALIRFLRGLSLHIPVVHCEKSIGESLSKGTATALRDAYERFEINCRIARHIGAEKMVLHLWDGQTSDSHFENNAAAYAALNQIARRYETDLLVENVVCTTADPMTRLRALREKYPDIHFVFDTKMAAFHDQTALLYAKEFEWLWKDGHIRHYHVNDYAGGYMDWTKLRALPVGTGDIDFDAFFAFVKRTGYDGTFTVEAAAVNDKGVVDIRMLNEQFRRLSRFLATGNIHAYDCGQRL